MKTLESALSLLTIILFFNNDVVSETSDVIHMAIQSADTRSVIGDSLRFFVIGDWGGSPSTPYTTPREISVAHQLEKLSVAFQPHFLLALGDNFYDDGVKNVNDKRFEDTFNRVFNQSSQSHYPWHVVAGNHDWHQNVDAQIAYSKLNPRWHFPNYSYAINYTFGTSNEVKVGIIMIDTVVMCGNVKSDFVDSEPEGPHDSKMADETWTFIENQMKLFIKYDYILIGGHYPVWSIAEHGPTQCLVDRLLPLLDKYDVTAYFSGHDHNLQHIRTDKSSGKSQHLHYFVSGAANYYNASRKHQNEIPKDSLQYSWSSTTDDLGGLGLATVTSAGMNVTFRDSFGNYLYSHVVKPRDVTQY